MKFEQSISRIDEIITYLENGDISLEQSLELYQEGVKLLSDCRDELTNAEILITITENASEKTNGINT